MQLVATIGILVFHYFTRYSEPFVAFLPFGCPAPFLASISPKAHGPLVARPKSRLVYASNLRCHRDLGDNDTNRGSWVIFIPLVIHWPRKV